MSKVQLSTPLHTSTRSFHVPMEVIASSLSALTVLLTLQPLNYPTWAAFVTWGGTFLLGDTTFIGSIKKMYPPLILGASFGVLATLLSGWSASALGAHTVPATITNMVIIFCSALILLYLGHLPFFSVTPAMFLSFAAFYATSAGNFGPAPHTLFTFWYSTILMICLGPILAWATMKLKVQLPTGMRWAGLSGKLKHKRITVQLFANNQTDIL
jgi:hypothetical protein